MFVLAQCSKDEAMKQWLRQQLMETAYVAVEANSLRGVLSQLDFRSVEQLIKKLLFNFSSNEFLRSEVLPLFIKEESSSEPLGTRSTNGTKSTILVIKNREVKGAQAVSQENLNSQLVAEPAPSYPIQRSLFEQLCFRYAKELLYFSKHLQLVTGSSSPYFFSKSEEYTSKVYDFFANFFTNSQVLEAFSTFIKQLLQEVAEHPSNWLSEIQREGMDSLHSVILQTQREQSVMLEGKLPFTIQLSYDPNHIYRIEKGRRFILQIGTAYLDYDQPKSPREQSLSVGCFKMLLRGNLLSKNSAVVYIGHEPFYVLTFTQLLQCKGVILLFLIAIRHKFLIELSDSLKEYLVESIPSTLKF